jgi:hypothetical protein
LILPIALPRQLLLPLLLLLIKPFAAQVLDGVVSDSFIRNWLDLLSFLLSGLPANGTIAAEVAFMVGAAVRRHCCANAPNRLSLSCDVHAW